jgi:hypothetical protein
MIDTLAIFAAGVPEGWGVAPHAARMRHLRPVQGRRLGVAFVNGTPVRRFPVTAPLPADLRRTFPLLASAYYSP